MFQQNTAEGMPVPTANDQSVITHPGTPTPFHLYQPDTKLPEYKRLNNVFGVSYPHKIRITDAMSLACACQASDTHHGHFKDGKTAKGKFWKSHSSQPDFINCDCIVIDVDNTPQNIGDPDIEPENWISPQTFREHFGDMEFYIVPSKSNQKQKDQYSPRPRFHVFMPTGQTVEYTELSKRYKQLNVIMPFMDPAYLCCTQKTGGNKDLNPSEVIYNPGCSVLDYLDKQDGLKDIKGDPQPKETDGSTVINSDFTVDYEFDTDSLISGDMIPRGNRHNTLKKAFAKIVYLYGDTEKSYKLSQTLINKCEPDSTTSAQNAFVTDAINLFNWILAHVKPEKPALSLMPEDFTEVGQSKIFVAEYGYKARFVNGLGWFYYNGIRWVNQDSTHKVKNWVEELTDRQTDQLNNYQTTKKLSDDERETLKNYAKHIKSMRTNRAIQSVLSLLEGNLLLAIDDLDRDPYILNTPSHVIDLRTATKRKHDPGDYCTQTTSFDPVGNDTPEGKAQEDLWLSFLQDITNGDNDLQHYLQLVLGSYIVGRVENMTMLYCYGIAGSGKSTFINALLQVVGDYGGAIQSDFFTTSTDQKTAGNMLAVNRGKRLVVANEIRKGQSFDQARMKHYVDNTQKVEIEEKFKQPVWVLQTANYVITGNDLFNVRDDTDLGLWDRLIVAPFNQRIRNTQNEIKDYQTILVNKAGGAILRWIIGGAKEFLENGSKIDHVPECCVQALETYQEESDWIQYFLADCCEIEGIDQTGFKVSMSELYEQYTLWNKKSEERYRPYNRKDFKNSLLNYSKVRITYRQGTGGSYYFYGIRLKPNLLF